MFCEKCGFENVGEGNFCENCGALLGEAVYSNSQSRSSQHKIPLPLWITGGVILVICIIVKIVLSLPTTIHLNNYVTVSYEGVDGYGVATASFDSDKFEEDYGELEYKKFKNSSERNEALSWFQQLEKPVEYVNEYVDGRLEKSTELKNGETIVYQWDCDEEAITRIMNVKLDYSDIMFTVSGLTEPREVNPFENLYVWTEGISGNGKLYWEVNSEDEIYDVISFEYDKSKGLANGDKVVLRICGEPESINEKCAEYYGVTLNCFEMEYTVEGLDGYVSKLEQISKDDMDTMAVNAAICIDEMVSGNWDSREVLLERKQAGSILESDSEGNNLYLIFQIKAKDFFEDENYESEFTYYTYYRAKDLAVDQEGKIKDIDDISLQQCSNCFEREVVYDQENGYYEDFYYYGYENLDELKKEIKSDNEKNYQEKF